MVMFTALRRLSTPPVQNPESEKSTRQNSSRYRHPAPKNRASIELRTWRFAPHLSPHYPHCLAPSHSRIYLFVTRISLRDKDPYRAPPSLDRALNCELEPHPIGRFNRLAS